MRRELVSGFAARLALVNCELKNRPSSQYSVDHVFNASGSYRLPARLIG